MCRLLGGDHPNSDPNTPNPAVRLFLLSSIDPQHLNDRGGHVTPNFPSQFFLSRFAFMPWPITFISSTFHPRSIALEAKGIVLSHSQVQDLSKESQHADEEESQQQKAHSWEVDEKGKAFGL
jgi:hypothetical protein